MGKVMERKDCRMHYLYAIPAISQTLLTGTITLTQFNLVTWLISHNAHRIGELRDELT